LSVANQRLYLLQQLKCQGLSGNALQIVFTDIVLSVVTYALPAFSGQLSSGDRGRQDGLFRKTFKRGLCSDVFPVPDLGEGRGPGPQASHQQGPPTKPLNFLANDTMFPLLFK